MKTNLQYIKQAWLKVLWDFRAYVMPDTQLLSEWKNRKVVKIDDKSDEFVANPIIACNGKLIDDAEAMLQAYRRSKSNTDPKKGDSAILPIVLTAVATIDDAPDNNRMIAVPYFVDCVLNGKNAKVRFKQKNVRCQIAFFSASQDDASSLSSEFCMYMMNEDKRRFPIDFIVGHGENGAPDDVARVYGTIWDNIPSAMDVPLQDNLYVFTVDVVISVPVPQVVLAGKHDVDNGANFPTMTPKVDEVPNDDKIKQADAFYKDNNGNTAEHSRMKYHDDTQERTTETGLKTDE